MQQDKQNLQNQVNSRDQEIQRLHQSYSGGQNFGQVKETHQIDSLRHDNHVLLSQLDEIAQIMGFNDFKNESDRRKDYGFITNAVLK